MSMFSSGKVAARVSTTLYHAGNLLPGTSAGSYWQMRATTQRGYKIPFAIDGVIDLGLAIHHTYKAAGVGVPLTASIQAFIDLSPAGVTEKGSQQVWNGTIPSDGRFTFTAERGTTVPGTATQKIIEVPELRQPIGHFYLYIAPTVAPDEGDLYLQITRRY